MSKIKQMLFLFIAVLVLNCNQVFAAGSGAFRVELPDSAAEGKGSAFVGEANTPAAIYYNPAGLTQIKEAVQVSVGGALIAPMVDFKPTSGEEIQMRRNTFFIPHSYTAVPFTDKLTFGLGATSYFGLGTEWAEDAGSYGTDGIRYVATESVIENKDIMLTAAYQLTDQWSLALSADNDDTKASKSKKLYQATTDGDFQLKAKDNAWGYRVATMFKANDQHSFGLMYRSAIQHKYEGKAYLEGLNNVNVLGGGTTSYQAVFGPAYETKFSEKFTLPQSVVIGYSFKPSSRWTFNFDLEWMDWSSVENEAINWLDETNATRLSVLNSGNPASRDWKSVWSQAFGAEYAATDKLRLRGGYYHHASPIPQDTWEPSLPDANSHGITTGFGYDFNKHLTLDMAYSGLIFEPRKIDNSVGSTAAGGDVVDGKYNQLVNMGLVTLTYKF